MFNCNRRHCLLVSFALDVLARPALEKEAKEKTLTRRRDDKRFDSSQFNLFSEKVGRMIGAHAHYSVVIRASTFQAYIHKSISLDDLNLMLLLFY